MPNTGDEKIDAPNWVELHSAHAYTLSSFLSRLNPRRDEYDGRTLEGRLRMIGKVMENVRRKVGHDWPVGVRFLSGQSLFGSGYDVVVVFEDAQGRAFDPEEGSVLSSPVVSSVLCS